MITCNVGASRINCYDGTYSKEELKKWSTKNLLLCPACGKPYEYCHGRVDPYFRHKDKAECEDWYIESETNEHIQGKQDLYEWLKNQKDVTDVVLEGWIPETHQRPDIMFKYNGKQYVLEYQCTPIASEYYERHDLYQATGIKDIWICGAQKYFQYYHDIHSGSGIKGLNVCEKESGYYYDPLKEMIFIIKPDCIKTLKKSKRFCNVLKHDISNYNNTKCNMYYVKDKSKNSKWDRYYEYKYSSFGHKYKKLVEKYNFIGNNSLAYCKKLNDIILGDV